MSKSVSERSNVSAYVILKGKNHVATVQAYHTVSAVQVDVINHGENYGRTGGRAGGYGYDKFTSALGGLVIDGHTMADHCGDCVKHTKANSFEAEGRKWFKTSYKPRKGYRFANGKRINGEYVYSDCYKDSGLDYLKSLGYTVISAV